MFAMKTATQKVRHYKQQSNCTQFSYSLHISRVRECVYVCVCLCSDMCTRRQRKYFKEEPLTYRECTHKNNKLLTRPSLFIKYQKATPVNVCVYYAFRALHMYTQTPVHSGIMGVRPTSRLFSSVLRA